MQSIGDRQNSQNVIFIESPVVFSFYSYNKMGARLFNFLIFNIIGWPGVPVEKSFLKYDKYQLFRIILNNTFAGATQKRDLLYMDSFSMSARICPARNKILE